MIKWFKKLFRIVREYDSFTASTKARLNNLNTTVQSAEKIIQDRTTISADISPMCKDPHIIFVSGRYRNVDYVQCYSIHGEDFANIIEILKEMKRYGTLRRLDAPHGFRHIFQREL
jgi:hypothetical protein